MLRKLIQKAKFLFYFLPGFLLWAAFPPMGEVSDAFFALAPAIFFARRNSPRKSFLCWFANGFFFWFATLAWMPAIIKNGGPWYLVVLGWLALAAYCALYFGLFGYGSALVWWFVKKRSYWWRLAAILFAEPILFAGLELIRSRFGGGFAWNHLGVPAVNIGFGAPAALGGIYLVSAAVFLVNGTFASIAERMFAPMIDGDDAPSVPKWARSVETILPLLAVFAIYSPAKLAANAWLKGGLKEVRFGLVQRNFPPAFKKPDSQADALKIYGELAARMRPMRPHAVVLPESALCEFGSIGRKKDIGFAQWMMMRAGADALVAGGSRMDAEGRIYNSAGSYSLSAEEECTLDGVYDKVHLVPFGEFIPGDKWITALQKLAPVGSCTPGEMKLVPVSLGEEGEIKAAVAICYEDTDSALLREAANMGAEVIIAITNDSWFFGSNETRQHGWQAVARAIETGLPVVRVGNSGVTATIDPSGNVAYLTGEGGKPLVDEAGCAVSRVFIPVKRGPTPYARLGDTPLSILFFLLTATISMVKYRHDNEERRKLPL